MCHALWWWYHGTAIVEKNWGGGKKKHSVLDSDDPWPKVVEDEFHTTLEVFFFSQMDVCHRQHRDIVGFCMHSDSLSSLMRSIKPMSMYKASS